MCLNPVNMISRSKYVDLSRIGMSSAMNSFNCGKCAECKQMMQNEYYYRAKAQYDATLLKNGIVYWDTLTYSQENVPVYEPGKGLLRGVKNKTDKGIFTFDRRDYVKFMKRLRINLSRAGYDVKDNLKYFFVSEYGGLTHRPHYHFIFYITINGITAEVINDFVVKSWRLGINDIDKTPQQKVIDGFGAINYVAKYVVKDDEYLKTIERYCKKYGIDDDDYKLLKPFHRQSIGFGEDIINQNDYQFLFDTGKMILTDTTGYHEVTIPMYIKRKLWYKLVKNEDGTLRWILNKEGQKQWKKTARLKVQKMAERFDSLYRSIDTFIEDESIIDIKTEIDDRMENRSFYDLAVYSFFYKGKVVVDRSSLPSVDQMIGAKFEYQSNDYSSLIKYSMENNIEFGDLLIKEDGGFSTLDGEFISFDTFKNNYELCQDDFIEFKHFDYILSLLSRVSRKISRMKEDDYNERQAIKNRLRTLKNKYNY